MSAAMTCTSSGPALPAAVFSYLCLHTIRRHPLLLLMHCWTQIIAINALHQHHPFEHWVLLEPTVRFVETPLRFAALPWSFAICARSRIRDLARIFMLAWLLAFAAALISLMSFCSSVLSPISSRSRSAQDRTLQSYTHQHCCRCVPCCLQDAAGCACKTTSACIHNDASELSYLLRLF